MKAEAEVGTIGYTSGAGVNGVGIFAGGLLTLLVIMVGVPLIMVVLIGSHRELSRATRRAEG